jgi:hypothetical protein
VAWETFTYVPTLGKAVAFGGRPVFDEFTGKTLHLYDPTTNTWEEVTQPSGGQLSPWT